MPNVTVNGQVQLSVIFLMGLAIVFMPSSKMMPNNLLPP